MSIREATIEDASLLCQWLNDGKVIELAGFPRGIDTILETVIKQFMAKTKLECRHIIFCSKVRIGETVYRIIDTNICEIGIKICDL